MKVVQVVPSIQGESAGPSYSVPALVEGISQNGCEMELHFFGQHSISYQICII